MFKLTIKKADGTIYWTQKFKSMDALNKWLDEEKTRAYWSSTYTTEIADLTPTPAIHTPDPAIALKLQQIQTLKDRLNTLDGQADLTAPELKEMARKFFKLFKLKGLID